MFNWSNIAIKDIRMEEIVEIEVGTSYHMEGDIFLGEIRPEDILVEAYCGRLDPSDQFVDRFTCLMSPSESQENQTYTYQCDIEFEEAGHFGLNVRVTPNHPSPNSRHAMGLVIWGSEYRNSIE
jgi:starch phosphorylase